MQLNSSSSDSSSNDSSKDHDDPAEIAPATIWLGNDDGEIYALNSHESVRTRAREKMNRLALGVTAISAVEDRVFVSIGSLSNNQLLYFERGRDGLWDLQKPFSARINLKQRIRPMLAASNRLYFASANNLFRLHPVNLQIEKTCTVSACPDNGIGIGAMTAHGSSLFVSIGAVIKLLDGFSLECVLEFSLVNVVKRALSGREEIIRQHKLRCLRVTAMLVVRNQLWIGTTTGLILATPLAAPRSNWTPTFSVCPEGHAGPCRFLTSVNVSSTLTDSFNANVKQRRRMSLNAPLLQQLGGTTLVVSGGEGVDEILEQETSNDVGMEDAVNHLLFWHI